MFGGLLLTPFPSPGVGLSPRPDHLREGMRGEGNEAGSGLPSGSHLSRSPTRSHQPFLRERAEPHASGGHYRPQDFADVKKVHSFESGGHGGIVKMNDKGTR